MAVLNSIKVEVILNDQYFDYENIEQPIQSRQLYRSFNLFDNYTNTMYTSIKSNTYVLNDNIYSITESEPNEFYSWNIDYSQLEFDNGGGLADSYYLSVLIEVNSEIDNYERTLYSFWDMTGTLGGIYEVMEILFGFLLGWYNSKLLHLKQVKYYNQQIYANKD